MKPAVLLVLILILTVILAYSVFDNPHTFSNEKCRDCHVDTERYPKKMTDSVTKLCGKCHKKEVKRSSHPVDIAPQSVTVAADLPLTDGMITCNTCHNIHGDRYTLTGQKTNFLRRNSSGRDFCLICHRASVTKNKHVEIVSVAHIGGKFTVINKNRALDPLSLECIGCHDSLVGRSADVSVYYGEGIWKHNRNAHPVGVNYRESRMKKGEFTPPEMLDKRLRLFGGKIGCGTCHDVYSKLPGQLVMSNDGSRLCLACHNK
ncbi:MAG: cytochrome c3 family protein [Nitrospirae bacterium]|nr:cytochrome c3 family protein [Nitrospirota bacterium]